MHRIRLILKAGSTVFGLSAVLLVATPVLFLDLLNFDGADSALQWSMRMIGITLVALAGNMWVNSKNQDDKAVETVGIVMAISATSLGRLTLWIPVSLSWFAILYAIVGFGFGAAYFVALILIKQIK